MKAYEVQEGDPDYEGIVQSDREEPTPDANEALVSIHTCSLNHRDWQLRMRTSPGADLPVIPLSDDAGEVVGTDDDDERLSEGDRVATPFAPNWTDGPGRREKIAHSSGGNVDGALAQSVTYPAESPAALPAHLSYEEGATLSCAGLTAWRALVEEGNFTAGETVLALGTGGVSTFALQFARMHGAYPIVTSSSVSKLDRARELDAQETIKIGKKRETPNQLMKDQCHSSDSPGSRFSMASSRIARRNARIP